MREDILVSICVVDDRHPGDVLFRIRTLIEAVSKHFRYFEIVYVVSEEMRRPILEMGVHISHFANLRIVFAGDGVRFYQKRVIAASEAIGDVVAVLDLDDLAPDALFVQIGRCRDENEILIGWQARPVLVSMPHMLLSALSLHHISPRASHSIILPREKLSRLLTRRSAALDLRFEPKSASIRYRSMPVARRRRHSFGFVQRYELLTEILTTGAPRYLKLYAASAFGVAFLAALYAIYAVLILATRADVAPGWFSTAIVQSCSVCFIAIGMSVLSISIAALLERLNGDAHHAIVGEIANIDFFDNPDDRNVELGDSTRDYVARAA